MSFLDSRVSNTRQKLLEAQYFLERMNENQTNGPAFRYNLSAFLAAARSVTMVMQKEFKKVSGFAQWYDKKRLEMRADQTMRYLNKRREVTIHQRPVPFHYAIRLDVYLAPIGSNKHSYSKVQWYFSDLPDPNKDVFTICKEYIKNLEHVVEECEFQFASAGL